MRIVPRMILILKGHPPSVSPVIQLIQAQTRLLTAVSKQFIYLPNALVQFYQCLNNLLKVIFVQSVDFTHGFCAIIDCSKQAQL